MNFTKRLDHGSQAVMTQRIVWGCFVFGFAGCFQKTGFRVSHPRGTPSARDDTVYGLMWSVSGLCVVMWLQKTGSRFSHPRGAPSARDDTVLGSGGTCFGGAFPTFHHSTSHRSCRSCHPRSISFSPPHHAITSPRSHHSTSPPLHLS